MSKIIFLTIILFTGFTLHAHTPQISSIALVQSKENKWNLVISASLSAFQYEWLNSNPDQKLDSIATDKFQAMIVQHLKNKIAIRANGQPGMLRNGKVILGHQTDINFDVLGMPDQLQSLHIQQLGFGTLRDHYCVLKVITKANSSNNFILQNGNKFSISLGLKDGVFTVGFPKKLPGWLLFILVPIILFLVFVFVYTVTPFNQILVSVPSSGGGGSFL